LEFVVTSVITIGESLDFAALSGDFNPLHVDPIRARRLRFGSSVVHGVHVLLSALESQLAADTSPLCLTSLRGVFSAPVATGTPFTVTLAKVRAGGFTLTVATAAGTAQELSVEFAAAGDAEDPPLEDREWIPAAPREIDLAGAAGGSIPLRLDQARLRRLFPNAAARLPARQLASILASTQVVGMECPGLHSVFGELALEFVPRIDADADELAYSIAKSDPRFGLVELALAGPGVTGRVMALFRNPPVEQPSYAEVCGRTAPGAYSDQRALVVGGSRGLGEVLAKIVAAGGGDVVITYHRGRDDAEALAATIVEAGGRCRTARYDVETQESDVVAAVPEGWSPTDVYFFSTPHIKANRAAWDAALFDLFCRYYVHGFMALVEDTERTFPKLGKKRRYVYPSTVYVDETPPGLREYASAKAAGETACRTLANKMKNSVEIVVRRLPRLLTDQTSADSKTEGPSVVDVIADVLLKSPARNVPNT
jgi:acyl dehydratase/NADP-dependent 3-hydroxy acid dehydrogenase YdfG